MGERERLVALFYTLMRDHLPTGVVEKAMEQVRATLVPTHVVGGLTVGRFRTPVYSVPELAQYAGRLADEILSGQMDIRPVPRIMAAQESALKGLVFQHACADEARMVADVVVEEAKRLQAAKGTDR